MPLREKGEQIEKNMDSLLVSEHMKRVFTAPQNFF